MQPAIMHENMGFQTQRQQDELMSDAVNHTLQLGEHHTFYDTNNSPPMVLLGDTPVERYTSASPNSHFQTQSLDQGHDPALHPSPLHYRTNFKEGGYVPPKVAIQPSRQPEIRQEQDAIYRRRGQFDSAGGLGAPHMMDPTDPDMPFDVLNEILRSNSSQTCSTSNPNPSNLDDLQEWQESETGDVLLSRQHDSCRRASPPSELDPDMGRFTMGAPKYSDPSPFLIDEVDSRHISGRSLDPQLVQKPTIVDTHIEIPNPEEKSGSDYEEFGLSPPSSVTDTVVDEAEAALLLSQLPRKSRDDDSLFENLEDDKVAVAMAGSKNKPQGQKKGRKLRVPSPLYRNVDGDDTSLEEVPNVKINSPKTLQERAAQAWAVRREKNAALLAKKEKDEKAKVEKDLEEFPHDEIIKKATKAGVSFGKADTVHHYQPEPDQDEENTCLTDEDRSLNSEYTKTLESEVEDVIKDILMIGDGKSSKPGRRKFKHKHSVKRKLRSRQKSIEGEDNSIPSDDADTTLNNEDAVAISRYRVQSSAGTSQVTNEEDDDDTLETDDRQQSVLEPKSEGSTNKQAGGDDGGEDPLQLVFGLVEGGMNAMTSALGLFAAEDAKVGDSTKDRSSKARSKRDSSLSKEISTKYVHVEPSQFSKSCPNDITPFLKKDRSSPSQCQPMSESEKSKSMKEFVNYAQDLLYGPLVENFTGESGGSAEVPGSKSAESDEPSMLAEGEEATAIPFSSSNLEEDTELVELARNAARSHHQLKGIPYDESSQIDLYTDIKFSVVELKLPLGLVFLENAGGCVVTKVSPEGSASRSGGVEVGDQLAAINGTTSIDMKVDDICNLIAKSPNPKFVELVFLRYQGPLRPAPGSPTEGSFDFGQELPGSPIGSGSLAEFRPAGSGQQQFRQRYNNTRPSTIKAKKVFRWFGRGKKKNKK